MNYETHPAADLFPMLGHDELRALADDIKENGQLEAIVLFDGKVLDGRNRLAACKLAGVEPRTVTMGFRSGEVSPTAWVLSKNLHRRQLTKSQAAAVAVEALPMLEAEARERQGARTDLTQKIEQGENRNAKTSAAVAGNLLGVNRQYVSDAKTIKRDAPDQFDAIRKGETTLSEAKREVARRKRRDELALQFEERKQEAEPLKVDAAVDAALQSSAQRKAAANFIRDLDLCVEALFRVMPNRNEFVIADEENTKGLERVALELEQIARDVRAYKETGHVEVTHS